MAQTTQPHDTEDEPAQRREVYLDFAAMIALALGLGALGFGTGLHVSLMSVQAAVMETTEFSLRMQAGADLYDTLLEMQAWANRSLYASAILLVGGGVLAERRGLADDLDRLANWIGNRGGGDDGA